MSHRSLLAWVIVLGGIALGGSFGVRAYRESRALDDLRLAKEDLNAGRHQDARERLDRLASADPEMTEVNYWLGLSALGAGDHDDAVEALRRVAESDPRAADAAVALGGLALEIGRYRLAEESLVRVADSPGTIGDQARELLGRLYALTGRTEDHRRALLQQAERLHGPTRQLAMLWSLDAAAYPVEGIRQTLEQAHAQAPNDDRVQLGLANLELRAGRFDEADRWLSSCEETAGADPQVARSRLLWSWGADRTDVAVICARRVPADLLSTTQKYSLRAWLDAKAGDHAAERATLEALLDREPGDLRALERLIGMAAESGQADRVSALRRQKAEIEAALERRRALMADPSPASRAAELAQASETLGAVDEARLWWRLAERNARETAARAEAADRFNALSKRLAAPSEDDGGKTVAEWLGPIVDSFETKTSGPTPKSVPVYVEDAEARGLVFTFDNGRSEARQLPETMSGGLALLDYDGDGWLDVYVVQGGPFPPPEYPPFGDRLFRNRGDGTFEDATEASGLSKFPGGYGHGVAVGDYDGDGRPDLFVTRWRRYALYRNLGDGTFEDATESAGLDGDRDWPTSAAFADLDGDGDLDLYVCHYLQWDEHAPRICPNPAGPGASYCDPRLFPAIGDRLYRNDDGRFVDVTESAGIVDEDGRGLGVVAADLDGDGRVDLFVTNDTTPDFFFRNEGGLRFAEKGMEAGLAASASGGYLAGMGIACGDLDGDGRIDLAVTNFYGESTSLHHNHGEGLFSDRSDASGLALATHHVLGFGIAALDADNDGRLDLAQTNGHVNDYRPATPHAMPAQLFLGDERGRLRDVSQSAGAPWSVPRVGRGLVAGDLDNDGRLEVLILASGEPLVCLHQADSKGRYIRFDLVGSESNRDAVGARVTISIDARLQVAQRFGGGSYQSAGDPRIHFGVGEAPRVDRAEITWPSGRQDVFKDLETNRSYRIVEADLNPRPLPVAPR